MVSNQADLNHKSSYLCHTTYSMKRLFYLLLPGMLFVLPSAAQNLCKDAKVGMSTEELTRKVGLPDSTTLLGVDNVTDSLFLWHYGTQDAMVGGGKIIKLIMDPKKENDLNQKVLEGTLPPLDYEQQLEELRQNSCD